MSWLSRLCAHRETLPLRKEPLRSYRCRLAWPALQVRSLSFGRVSVMFLFLVASVPDEARDDHRDSCMKYTIRSTGRSLLASSHFDIQALFQPRYSCSTADWKECTLAPTCCSSSCMKRKPLSILHRRLHSP